MAASLGGKLELADEGSFFVNAHSLGSEYPGASPTTGPASAGTITVNQMYVHFRVPAGPKRAPIVMVHGSNHTGMTYETTPDDVAKFFGKVPFISVWGDNSVGAAGANGDKRRNGCLQAVNMIKDGGGKATYLLLPESGIPGNSHMLMMDRNNLQIAGLIRKWIEENVC